MALAKTWTGIIVLFVVLFNTSPAYSDALPLPGSDRLITRIAFGSCAFQSVEQPIFRTLVASKPDLYLSLGDAIYGDYDLKTKSVYEVTPETLRREWQVLAGNPDWQYLVAHVPVMATWDNHDYGHHSAGAEFPLKAQSKKIFLDFFGDPENSARRHHPGLYDARTFGPQGQRVQVILLDTRSFKSPPVLADRPKGAKGSLGKYAPNTNPDATLLGRAQWAWLEHQLREPADIRLVASSGQIVADQKGMDEWGNYPLERQRLFGLIESTGATGVLLLSGNVHFSEVSLTDQGPYPLVDFTSSGLTHVNKVYPTAENRYRVAGPYLDQSFGLVEIDWQAKGGAAITLSAVGLDGQKAFVYELNNSSASPRFGGPDSVERIIEIDRTEKGSFTDSRLFQPVEEWLGSLEDEHGFNLGLDYTAVTLNASDTLPGADDSASGGMVRLYGRWNLTGDGETTSGGLIYKFEHRHDYGDPAPSGFYLGNVGYAGLTAPPFSHQGDRVTNLYWRQSLTAGKTVVLAGFLDATDFVDIYGLASPWLHFMNLAFSTGSAAIDLPNDAALGVAAAHLFHNNWYAIGSVLDRNSDPTDISDGFDTFFNDNEYFSSIEIGRTSSHSRMALDNMHLTLWHVDSRQEVGGPNGWGANFSWSRYYNNRIMPFIRAGYTDDSGSLLEKSVSVGFGFQPDPSTAVPGDLFGAAINWGEVNELSFGPDLDDQYTLEIFYRWQLTPRLALTSDLQYLKDPALNPDEDSIYIWAFRGRFSL